MKASRVTDAQMASMTRRGEDGTPMAEICRSDWINQATCYSWKKRLGGLLPDEMRRLKPLEGETARLKKLVADLTLDRDDLQDQPAPNRSSGSISKRPPIRQNAWVAISLQGPLLATVGFA